MNNLYAPSLSLLLLFSVQAHSAGFALIEQSASGQGLSYAGAAANTEDASVMWFNAAGITDVDQQFIFAVHGIGASAKFNNDGSYIKNSDGSTSPLFGDESTASKASLLPNFYWKSKFADLDVGLGINVPFGSTIEYDDDWVGRYHAVYTQTKSFNINPTIAKKINDNFSVGFGLNAQYLAVNLTQKINFGLTSTPQTNDGYADLEATSLAFGYNLGLMYDFKKAGQLGFSYRSQINHHAEGKAKFTLPSNVTSNAYDDSDIKSNVVLPATASLSYVYPVNNKMQVLADASWTGWSSFEELRIEFDNPAKGDSVQPEEWTDSMRYSLGMTYQVDDNWQLRTGVALDKTPIKDKYLRTPRITDSDRTWLSVGLGYQINKDLNLDFAYTHIMTDNPEIEATDADTGSHVLKGDFGVNIDIVSLQLVWKY